MLTHPVPKYPPPSMIRLLLHGCRGEGRPLICGWIKLQALLSCHFTVCPFPPLPLCTPYQLSSCSFSAGSFFAAWHGAQIGGDRMENERGVRQSLWILQPMKAGDSPLEWPVIQVKPASVIPPQEQHVIPVFGTNLWLRHLLAGSREEKAGQQLQTLKGLQMVFTTTVYCVGV